MSNNTNDWSILSKQIHDELNEIKRDVLVPYAISVDEDVENAQDLYEKLLIDVEMGSCGTTSRIEEAIAALQLYFHRYFVNLENPEVKDGQTLETVKKELKTWWKWMKNYRVWEANRKVFLYPENYIRPELRDTKTPAFKTLEEDLLQGEITEASVQRAYKKYLDEYTEVSRLTIAGGYVYSPSDLNNGEQNLILFGSTKTDPRRYYYRFAEFKSDSVLWKPWLSVNVQIDADRVYPVFAFGRVFVFWTKIETEVENSNTTTLVSKKTNENTQKVASQNLGTDNIKIFYSFYNLNKEWVSPQELTEVIKVSDISLNFVADSEILIDFQLSDVRLFVENSQELGLQEKTAKHENIVINCTYKISTTVSWEIKTKDTRSTYSEKREEVYFHLTPELYTQKIDPTNFNNKRKASLLKAVQDIVGEIFDEPGIDVNNIVLFNTSENSSDAPWFSFDHKGGSFLSKPDSDYTPESIEIKKYLDQFGWEEKDVIAVQTPKKIIYLFKDKEYVVIEKEQVNDKNLIEKRWGKVKNKIADTGKVDAALFDGNKTYLFSGNEYLVYSQGLELADMGSPKQLENNSENLPKWDKIDAALRKDGKNYFFNNTNQTYVISDALTEEKSTREFWGQMQTSSEIFKEIKELTVTDAAFILGDYTYLINSEKFIKYKNNSYQNPEAGYPKEYNFYTLLEDLGCENKQYFHTRNTLIYAAYDINGSDILFFTKDGNYKFKFNDKKLYRLSDGESKTGIDSGLSAIFAIGDVRYEFYSGKQLFVSNQTLNCEKPINAAFVGKDEKIYLFSGQEYISFDKAGITAETLVKQINKWKANNIAETGIVDAAFYEEGKIYLFSDDQY
ncbi:MAG: neuraminidase-like domain-containing protein, partial [Phormidium sp.]